jgi:hypothetical protein
LAQAGVSYMTKKFTFHKFTNIAYPIFALRKKPYKIIYGLDKIWCIPTEGSHMHTIDDKKLSGDYFSRLLQLEHHMLFDLTCRNLQDLLFSKAKWGIDSKGVPHDFSKLYAAKVEKRKVVKIVGNLFWLRNISYPFEITTQEIIRLEDTIYATLVFVNMEWYIKEFSYDSDLIRPYIYV